MDITYCQEHNKVCSDMAVIKNDLSHIRQFLESKNIKIEEHIKEANCEGGHRDILRDNTKDIEYLKKQISEIKKSKWQSGAIGGAVVFVLTKSPEIGHMVITLITKIAFAGQ